MPPRVHWYYRHDTETHRWLTACNDGDCGWQSSWYHQKALASRAAVHHRRLVHLRASSENHQ